MGGIIARSLQAAFEEKSVVTSAESSISSVKESFSSWDNCMAAVYCKYAHIPLPLTARALDSALTYFQQMACDRSNHNRRPHHHLRDLVHSTLPMLRAILLLRVLPLSQVLRPMLRMLRPAQRPSPQASRRALQQHPGQSGLQARGPNGRKCTAIRPPTAQHVQGRTAAVCQFRRLEARRRKGGRAACYARVGRFRKQKGPFGGGGGRAAAAEAAGGECAPYEWHVAGWNSWHAHTGSGRRKPVRAARKSGCARRVYRRCARRGTRRGSVQQHAGTGLQPDAKCVRPINDLVPHRAELGCDSRSDADGPGVRTSTITLPSRLRPACIYARTRRLQRAERLRRVRREQWLDGLGHQPGVRRWAHAVHDRRLDAFDARRRRLRRSGLRPTSAASTNGLARPATGRL